MMITRLVFRQCAWCWEWCLRFVHEKHCTHCGSIFCADCLPDPGDLCARCHRVMEGVTIDDILDRIAAEEAGRQWS
jgi:hypothetical protein